jgi:hypothetical protein
MNGNDHLRQTLDYYRQQLKNKLDELGPLQLMIRQLERELGESSGAGSDLSDLASGAAFQTPTIPTFSSERPSSDIRPDEFFGMSHNEAAKTYLGKIGRAVSMDELVAALKKGGAQLSGATPKKSLYVSLMRNPLREFVSPSENHIGLRSFYPGLPKTEKNARLNKAKKGKPRKKQSATKHSKAPVKNAAATKTKSVSQATSPKQEPTKGIPTALSALMKDGKARSKENIVKELESNLGHPIPKIAVYGTLKGKQYEKQDNGDYRFVSVQ